MLNKQSRRTFLKLSALGLGTGAATGWARARASSLPPAPEGDISVRVTSGTEHYRPAPSLSWRTGGGAADNVITLDPATKHQAMLGFGAAFTDASCYVFHQLPPSSRESLFHELFHPSEMGLNVCRTCMGSSDYATEMFSYDEGEPDPEMKRFSIAHDQAYVLPMLRQARKVNPDLFLFSSPWSPSGWMKVGGSMRGGTIRQSSFGPYAQYFVKFLEGYAREGVPVQAVTVQNEVDTDQDGRMPACAWPQEYEINFVKGFLGPQLEKNNLSTKIWILDHNYNLWGRAVGELEDPGLRKYCNAVAFHGYVGEPEMMSKVHDANPDVQLYWTEGGPDYKDPEYATDWTNWAQTFTQVARNWCDSITGWNLALDEQGRPNIGPFSCGGLVTIHSRTQEITRSGQYWAFAHFSRNVRRGARRFESSGKVTGVDHVAFENPDGKKVLVVTNADEAKSVTLEQANKSVEVELLPKSVSTLVWS